MSPIKFSPPPPLFLLQQFGVRSVDNMAHPNENNLENLNTITNLPTQGFPIGQSDLPLAKCA
ncbi:hypothetical protein PVK06_032093 [Gossypium arboreum]|uniref:Uncharacterized protein n=1 Tax=Gossypium arboreum TaxID=29729 RepID=A0ABR0NVC6_GOSAR|nr:hypothetical protein PVK06_032093 [Gossypium arboreum]